MKKRIMDFGDMRDALIKAYKKALKGKYEYKGPDLTSSSLLAAAPKVNDWFKQLEIDDHDTPLEVLVTCAIRLGIQQGIYMCSDEPDRYIDVEDENFDEFYNKVKMLRFAVDPEAWKEYLKDAQKRIKNKEELSPIDKVFKTPIKKFTDDKTSEDEIRKADELA